MLAVADQHREEQAHEVGVATVGEELQLGVAVDDHPAAGGDVVPGLAILGQAYGEDRFAVRAHQLAESVTDPR